MAPSPPRAQTVSRSSRSEQTSSPAMVDLFHCCSVRTTTTTRPPSVRFAPPFTVATLWTPIAPGS
jgi:hypothetical protein